MGTIVLGAGVAHASTTGLNLIPIADILGHREVSLQFSSTGYERRINKGYDSTHGLSVGLFDRCEVGYDNDFRGGTLLNAKVQLVRTPKTGNAALTVGVQNVDLAHHTSAQYLVGRADLPGIRLHVGVYHDDRLRLIAGVDGSLPAGLSYQLDMVSGNHAYGWAGVNVPLGSPRLAATFALGLPAAHHDGVQHQISVAYGFRF